MLTLVLIDHCGGVLQSVQFVHQWTLMGVGWSDAAEVFVFLSGFTLGWAYSERIARRGVWAAIRHGLTRTLQIYLYYLACVIGVLVVDPLQLGQGTADVLDNSPLGILWMDHQPFAVSILCFYVVCLPTTLLLIIAFWHTNTSVLLLLSYLCYGTTQVFPWLNLATDQGAWPFNPFAWQLLMICPAILGRTAREGKLQMPRAISLQLAACAVLVFGLLFQKGEVAFGMQAMGWLKDSIGFDHWSHEWLCKKSLCPLRLLHFIALAYLVALIAPLRSQVWTHWIMAPFRACGSHSLEVYCIGAMLSHLCRLLPPAMPASSAGVILIMMCGLQFFIGALLELLKGNKSAIGKDRIC